MLGALLAFACGVSIGILIGRRMTVEGRPVTSARPRRDEIVLPPAPTEKARKLGITDELFTPADDILERLRKVDAGEVDPSVLAAEPGAAPPVPRPSAPAPAAAEGGPDELSELERRVLERLRSVEPEEG